MYIDSGPHLRGFSPWSVVRWSTVVEREDVRGRVVLLTTGRSRESQKEAGHKE